jgi:hypothetical protein
MQFISPVLVSILGRAITPSQEAEQSTPIVKYGKTCTKEALKSCRRRLGAFFRGEQNWAYCGFIWKRLSGLIFRSIRFSRGIWFRYLSTPMYFLPACQYGCCLRLWSSAQPHDLRPLPCCMGLHDWQPKLRLEDHAKHFHALVSLRQH